MYCGQNKLSRNKTVSLQYVAFSLSNRGEIETVVIHHIAALAYPSRFTTGKMGTRLKETLSPQITYCSIGGSETNGRKLVTNNTIDLLRHSHIERAKARFNVKYGHMMLRSSHRSGQGRISVAIKHNAIKSVGRQHLLYTLDHLSSLNAVSTRTDSQIVRWGRYAQFAEKHLRHICVIMLARVQYMFLHNILEIFFDSTGECSRLNNLRASTNYG